MRVSVGYSDNSATIQAGAMAVKEALASPLADKRPCDVVLLFATARHNPYLLYDTVRSLVGPQAQIVGGATAGALSNRNYGYAGDQIGVAAIWLEQTQCDIIVEDGLDQGEEQVGRRIGKRLAALSVSPDSPVMLFFDSVSHTGNDLRLFSATPLLQGIQNELGFQPRIFGAGLRGDFMGSSTKQLAGGAVTQCSALALLFGGDVRIDNVIMHGCRPATDYYTVTKADNRTILEIEGRPALQFVKSVLGSSVAPEEYGLFLLFGVNYGEQWAEFDEKNYASRLCLGIDPQRDGIIMFEQDMTEGTKFQIMHKNLDLGYIKPRIDALFENLSGRKPVFAFSINCAGRAAGYAGSDLEDALAVQKAIDGRIPLLGIYSSMEIAPVAGIPTPMDWTSLFCLFSVGE